jgi:putative protease
VIRKPELLAPVGDFEKLKFAINYGADAVYLAGQSFGLRAYAKNFDLVQLTEAIQYAHSFNVKVYLVMNIFANNNDIEELVTYVKNLEGLKLNGIVVADMGVFDVVKEYLPYINLHVSTQANNTNYRSILSWIKMGAKRIITARELSLNEIREIKTRVSNNIELEGFIHGSMCIAYSGRCILSNYISGRSANSGECSQVCRFKFSLIDHSNPSEDYPVYEDSKGTYILSSKDLCMIEHLDELVDAGLDSLKIEGRMKSSYYVGSVVMIYREALDDLFRDKELYDFKKTYYLDELRKTSHRGFSTGFYLGKPSAKDQMYNTTSYVQTHSFIAMVVGYDEEKGIATIEQRNKFLKGDVVEIVSRNYVFEQSIGDIQTMDGEFVVEASHPKQLLKIKVDSPVKIFDMIRREK